VLLIALKVRLVLALTGCWLGAFVLVLALEDLLVRAGRRSGLIASRSGIALLRPSGAGSADCDRHRHNHSGYCSAHGFLPLGGR
jgi:hypothetical protein